MSSITQTLVTGAVGVIGVLVGAAITAIVPAHLNQRYDELKQKRDVLARLAGNRHFLADPLHPTDNEPFISMNEIFVVFSDSPPVIAAVKSLHQSLGHPQRFEDNLLTLIKALAAASEVRIDDLNDDFIMRPFGRVRNAHVHPNRQNRIRWPR